MVFDRLTAEQVGQLAAISEAIEAGVETVGSSDAAAPCRAARDEAPGAGAPSPTASCPDPARELPHVAADRTRRAA